MKNLIVITGGTRGIGKAIAFRFAAAGFEVVTCSSKKSNIESFISEFETSFPGLPVHVFQADLARKEEVNEFCLQVLSLGKPIEILVNNAGVFMPGSVLEEEEGVLDFQLDVNLKSAYHISRKLIKKMVEKGRGSVFNICSTASITPYVNGGSYCISKFALLGMSKVLREELKEKNIKVTSVIPGATYTDSWAASELPESRFMKSEDIANAILGAYQMSENTVIEELLIRPQLGDI